MLCMQASLIAEEVLRENADAVRVLFNKFHSAISFKPTMATVLSAEGIERQLATDQGSKLDTYELEVAAERGDVLQDLAEFQLAAVSKGWVLGERGGMEGHQEQGSEKEGRGTCREGRHAAGSGGVPAGSSTWGWGRGAPLPPA